MLLLFGRPARGYHEERSGGAASAWSMVRRGRRRGCLQKHSVFLRVAQSLPASPSRYGWTVPGIRQRAGFSPECLRAPGLSKFSC